MPDAPLPWRPLVCQRCKQPVEVLFIPDDRECNPATFVGHCCRREKRSAK